MSKIGTAIRLKQALDNINCLNPIGFKKEVPKKTLIGDLFTALVKLKNCTNSKNFVSEYFCGLEYLIDFEFFPGTEKTMKFNLTQNFNDEKQLEFIKTIYENARASGFGDMETVSTKVDLKVRNAKELIVGEDVLIKNCEKLCQNVEKLWKSNYMYPGENIKAVPYKIVLYGPGGMFMPHCDTPANNLVGSFLIGLGSINNDSCKLVVQDKDGSKHEWYGYRNQWCAFYPDLKHEVTKMIDENGYRMIMAFKIETQGGDIENEKELFKKNSTQQIKEAIKKFSKPFGLLLGHTYSRQTQTTAFKGMDFILHNILTEMSDDVELQLIPVMVKTHSEYPLEGKCTSTSKVYWVSDKNIEYLLRETEEQEIFKNNKIPFYKLTDFRDVRTENSKPFIWSHSETEQAEYTGNEARAGEEDCLAIHMALIVTPIKNKIKESPTKKAKIQ